MRQLSLLLIHPGLSSFWWKVLIFSPLSHPPSTPVPGLHKWQCFWLLLTKLLGVLIKTAADVQVPGRSLESRTPSPPHPQPSTSTPTTSHSLFPGPALVHLSYTQDMAASCTPESGVGRRSFLWRGMWGLGGVGGCGVDGKKTWVTRRGRTNTNPPQSTTKE